MESREPPKFKAWIIRNGLLFWVGCGILAAFLALGGSWAYAAIFALACIVVRWLTKRFRKEWPEYAKEQDQKLEEAAAERKKQKGENKIRKQQLKEPKKPKAKKKNTASQRRNHASSATRNLPGRTSTVDSNGRKRYVYVQVLYADRVGGSIDTSSRGYVYRWRSTTEPICIGDWVLVGVPGSKEVARVVDYGRRSDFSGNVKDVRKILKHDPV